jgi:hypothetical protein
MLFALGKNYMAESPSIKRQDICVAGARGGEEGLIHPGHLQEVPRQKKCAQKRCVCVCVGVGAHLCIHAQMGVHVCMCVCMHMGILELNYLSYKA